MTTWEARLRAVRVRLLQRGAAEEGPRLALVTTALWAAGTLLARTVGGVGLPWPWPWGLGASLLAAVLLLPLRLRHQLGLGRAAETSDRFLNSRDLLATALWLQGQRPLPAAGPLVLQRAAAAASSLDPARAVGAPAAPVLVRRLAVLTGFALLGVWASLAALPTLWPGGVRPPQEVRLPVSHPRAIEDEPLAEPDPQPALRESLKELEEQLAEGEATPQAARETLDRLLRGLEAADPGSAPRSPLSPTEQSELESLLERVIGRSGDPASGVPGEPSDGRDGSGEPDGGTPGDRTQPQTGPGDPSFDPGQEPGSPGTGPGQEGPSSESEVPGGTGDGQSHRPLPGEMGGQEPPGDREGPDGEQPGSGPRPGTEPGDPFQGPGNLPPPAASSGEQDVLPSTPEPGPYGLGEGVLVPPAAPLESAGLPERPRGPAPGADPGEEPVAQPLLPALYREWLQRYFAPASP
ncbi:hypothetical protein [Limnochorda pilosa]|uniref:Uncharacterized protein n=1 Tax=Limnochorda pilosa TaxID=1555112 RepID=A0A0K2SPC8_LIMPI|nr:hypothetical protein [Limnochorda pilosa]BAS28980.1 hypothetical protein LIP_3153 [Limnochorda pilosa]